MDTDSHTYRHQNNETTRTLVPLFACMSTLDDDAGWHQKASRLIARGCMVNCGLSIVDRESRMSFSIFDLRFTIHNCCFSCAPTPSTRAASGVTRSGQARLRPMGFGGQPWNPLITRVERSHHWNMGLQFPQSLLIRVLTRTTPLS